MCVDYCKRCKKQVVRHSGDLNLNGYCEECAKLSVCKKCHKHIDPADRDIASSFLYDGKCVECFKEDNKEICEDLARTPYQPPINFELNPSKRFKEDDIYKTIDIKKEKPSLGWICPKCLNIYSPYVESCWRCSNKEIT